METVASGFQGRPVAVKFDSRDRLHVLDTGAGEVVRVDVATGDTEVVGRVGVGSDNLAFNAEDRLFVSSFTDSSIVEVTGPETNPDNHPGWHQLARRPRLHAHARWLGPTLCC